MSRESSYTSHRKLTHTFITLAIATLTLTACGRTEAEQDPDPTENISADASAEQDNTMQDTDTTTEKPYSGYVDSYPIGQQSFTYTDEGSLVKFDIPAEPSEQVE